MKTKTTKEFDTAFDAGNDITDSLDLSRSKRVNCEQKRVNVDFPVWMLNELDKEAHRLGIPRQSLIKTLIGRHYEEKSV
jgi:hypothetical protein